MTPWPLGVIAPDTSYAVAAPRQGASARSARTAGRGGGPSQPSRRAERLGLEAAGPVDRRPRSPTWRQNERVVGPPNYVGVSGLETAYQAPGPRSRPSLPWALPLLAASPRSLVPGFSRLFLRLSFSPHRRTPR